MKDLSYFVLCLVLLPIISFAQVGKQDTPPPFLYLRNGTLLKEGEFEIKGGLFGKRFRYNNGDKINFNDIKFYQGEDGYFANYYGLELEKAYRIINLGRKINNNAKLK